MHLPMIAVLALLALIGLPLFIILSLASILGYSSLDIFLSNFFADFIRLAENPILVAIPLFTFAGYILAESDASKRLVRLAQSMLFWLPGGLAIVVLVVMAIFTAFSGASGVTIIAMGGMMMPALLRGKFKERFSLGLITVSGSVGLLFPPSLPLIIYGVIAHGLKSPSGAIANTPVNEMFIGGFLPGLLMIAAISTYIVFRGVKNVAVKSTGKIPVLSAFKETAWELPLPFIIIGGIYGGFITAAEAAIVTAAYLVIVECFIIRDIHIFKDLPNIMIESSILTGGILLILGSALALTNFFVLIDLPLILLNWIQSIVASPLGFLLMLNVFLLIVGCLMDIFSALVVVVPLIVPVALEYGIDPVHLGVIFLTNLEIGYNTPPVGLNLFISSFRFKKPVLDLYRAALPFLAIQIIVLILVTYIPALTLYPVNLFSK